MVYTLTYFDGKDEGSGFTVEGAIETARRSGVTIYAIGLAEVTKDKEARNALRQIAEQTGGQSFSIDSPAELPAIYRSISEDLRSRYLLTYQSTSTADSSQFRTVRVEIDEKGAEVRTISGYYP